MKNTDPIILIDDDDDDCEILRNAFAILAIPNPLLCFRDTLKALEYLRITAEQPFLILCDINMPGINGIELRKLINREEYLRRKSIPFIFYTTYVNKATVLEAYDMEVQGFFEKGNNITHVKQVISAIYTYWGFCRHPND